MSENVDVEITVTKDPAAEVPKWFDFQKYMRFAPGKYEPMYGPPRPRKTVKGSYMRRAYEQGWLKRAVARVDALLRGELAGKFDTIAFSGHSGAAVAYPLGALGYDLTCVRKRGEKSHHGEAGISPVEGLVGESVSYVIVDDLICTGSTVRRIREEIEQEEPSMRCVALISYMHEFEAWQRQKWEKEGITLYDCLPGDE